MCQISPFMLYHASYELTLLSCSIPTMPGCYQPHALWEGVWALSLKRRDSQKIWKLVEVYVCWRHVKRTWSGWTVSRCTVFISSLPQDLVLLITGIGGKYQKKIPKVCPCRSILKRSLNVQHVQVKDTLALGILPRTCIYTICLYDDYDIRLLKPIQHGIDTVLKEIWDPDIPSLHLPLNNIWGIQKIPDCLGCLGDYTPTWGSQWAIIQVPINQPGWNSGRRAHDRPDVGSSTAPKRRSDKQGIPRGYRGYCWWLKSGISW